MRQSHRGFLLLDVLLGAAVFTVIITGVGWALLSSQSIGIWSGDRMRAIPLTEQIIEATRSIRDRDFSLLAAGVHGVRVNAQGLWEFSGTGSVSSDGFATAVSITLPSADQADIAATTEWAFSADRKGSITLRTVLTNWRQERQMGDWRHVSIEGFYLDDALPDFRDVLVRGNYAFVTGSADSGGAGLYIFDITDLEHPERTALGFTLPGGGWQMAAIGNILYVLTGNEGGEVAAYDISSPVTLSSANLLGNFDMPGGALARSIALYQSTLFVGTTENEEDEFYALDVVDPSNMTLLDSLPIEGGVLDIRLHDGYAYIASSRDVSELIVIDIFIPAQMRDMGGFNLTDVPDGTTIAVTGTSALLGRSVGDATEELVLFDLAANPVPSPPPLPWYHDVGGTVNGLTIDATGRYAFLATDYLEKEFVVVDLPTLVQHGYPVEIATYHTASGNGRAVLYDIVRDRVFFATTSALIIFMPAP
ncbi:MAG: hypothetical protein V1926_01480 [Candidatus Peregrinibacteria bacterium]